MFLKANYHAHTTRCQHAYGSEREYIQEAIRMGIEKFGFSDHVPFPAWVTYHSGIRMREAEAEEYRDCIRSLAEEYKMQIKLYLGFETEYVAEYFPDQIRLCDQLGVDYMILGQHFLNTEEVGPWTGTPTEDQGRIRQYVDTVITAMETGRFLYVAHPDIMSYVGLDSVYEWEMGRLCQRAKELSLPLEINVLGMGQKKSYPRRQFWQLAAEVGNDVILGMDAHCPEQVSDQEACQKSFDLARELGLHVIDGMDLLP